MSSTEPAFRRLRFPWMQLVFCLACLAMAAYTLMRYSWAREVDLDDAASDPLLFEGAFVRVHGRVGKQRSFDKTYYRYVVTAKEDKQAWMFLSRGEVRDDEGASVVVEGRFRIQNLRGMFGLGISGPVIDTNASRFHGASIAGLAVGVMGCFIFGLYLRRWLCERGALAGGSGRGMIA